MKVGHSKLILHLLSRLVGGLTKDCVLSDYVLVGTIQNCVFFQAGTHALKIHILAVLNETLSFVPVSASQDFTWNIEKKTGMYHQAVAMLLEQSPP